MLEVEGSLAYYVCHALQGSRYAHLSFEISGATVPVKPQSILHREGRTWRMLVPTWHVSTAIRLRCTGDACDSAFQLAARASET